MREKNKGYRSRIDMVGVEVQAKGSSFWVRFYDVKPEDAPYRLENCTRERLLVGQKLGEGKLGEEGKETKKNMQLLDVNQALWFTWDQPLQSHKLVVSVVGKGIKRDFGLDKIKEKEWREGDLAWKIIIYVDGSTRVMRLFELKDGKGGRGTTEGDGEGGKKGKGNKIFTQFEKKISKGKSNKRDDVHGDIVHKTEYNICHIGISFMNQYPQEFMYVHIDGIGVEMKSSRHEFFYETKIKNAQADNQMYSCSYPVLMYLSSSSGPVSPPVTSEKNAIHMSVTQSAQSCPNVDRFRYVSFLMQELNLRVDEEWVNQILTFFNLDEDPNKAEQQYGKEKKNDIVKMWEDVVTAPPKSQDFNYVYIDSFHINPMKINLSFLPALLPNRDSPFRRLVGALGVGVVNVENAPVMLNSLWIETLYLTRKDLMDRISQHYIQQGLTQVYKIVFSFDVLGNPVSLVSNLGTGVKDFFYEPAQGLVQSPMAFGRGVAKGSTSLVKHSVYGLSSTVSKISESMGKGVATLSMDQQYLQEREEASRQQPRHVGEGLIFGMKELGLGVYKGATGVVMDPIKGAKQDGLPGFAKGVGTGLIGVAVKPGVGILDMATRTTQGIKATAVYFDIKTTRKREPRYIGSDGRLRVYDAGAACCQSLLAELEDGKYKNHWYLFNAPLIDRSIVLVTQKMVLLVSFATKPTLEWKVLMPNITKLVRATPTSLIISYQKKSGKLAEHTINTHDSVVGTWLYAQLDKAIRVYHNTLQTHGSERCFL